MVGSVARMSVTEDGVCSMNIVYDMKFTSTQYPSHYHNFMFIIVCISMFFFLTTAKLLLEKWKQEMECNIKL